MFANYIGKFQIKSVEFKSLSLGTLPPTIQGKYTSKKIKFSANLICYVIVFEFLMSQVVRRSPFKAICYELEYIFATVHTWGSKYLSARLQWQIKTLPIGTCTRTIWSSVLFLLVDFIHRLTGIKVHETNENDLVFETAVRWAGNPNIALALKLLSLQITLQVRSLSRPFPDNNWSGCLGNWWQYDVLSCDFNRTWLISFLFVYCAQVNLLFKNSKNVEGQFISHWLNFGYFLTHLLDDSLLFKVTKH